MVRTLVVPGRYDQLETLCRFVAAAAEEAGLSETDSSRCQLAVDEACTNVIEHGYGGEDKGDIRIACASEPGELTVIIEDSARRFDPSTVPEPNLGANLDDIRIGGLGVYFMRQVMDAVEFSYEEGRNQLVLVKRRSE